MIREVLHLPEPARTLLRATFETIDGALGEVVPEGRRWRLGGRNAANRASVGLATGDGWKAEETFASGRELAVGLTRLGLERLMLRSHRSKEAFVDAADAKMAARRPG